MDPIVHLLFERRQETVLLRGSFRRPHEDGDALAAEDSGEVDHAAAVHQIAEEAGAQISLLFRKNDVVVVDVIVIVGVNVADVD